MNTEKIIERINSIPKLSEAIRLVKKNSEGKVWLIGSAIYRSIINEIYGGFLSIKDFDFIVGNLKEDLSPSEKTQVGKSRYGNLKIKYNGKEIDIVPILNIHSIKRKNIPATIENYLAGVPFTVQSIAFDIDKQEIIGKKSIESILNKKIEINDLEEAKYSADLMDMSLEERMGDMANRLNFDF